MAFHPSCQEKRDAFRFYIHQSSNEYLQLIEELKRSINSSIDIASKLFEQGKRDGLSNEVIRQDIELALEGVIKDRQLRNILPPELKRAYNITSVNSAIVDSNYSCKKSMNGECRIEAAINLIVRNSFWSSTRNTGDKI